MYFLLTIFSFAVNSPGSSCRAKWQRGGASLRQPRWSPHCKSPPSPPFGPTAVHPTRVHAHACPQVCVHACPRGASHQVSLSARPPPPTASPSSSSSPIFVLPAAPAVGTKGFFSCNLDVSFQKAVNTFSVTLGGGERNNKRVEKDANGR